MARDQSEYIDEYCRDNYGHTNWGYLDTYTQEELKKPDHDIEKELVIVCGDRVYKSNNIVFWYNGIQNEEESNDT